MSENWRLTASDLVQRISRRDRSAGAPVRSSALPFASGLSLSGVQSPADRCCEHSRLAAGAAIMSPLPPVAVADSAP